MQALEFLPDGVLETQKADAGVKPWSEREPALPQCTGASLNTIGHKLENRGSENDVYESPDEKS